MGAVWEEMSKRVRNEERKVNRMRIKKNTAGSQVLCLSLYSSD